MTPQERSILQLSRAIDAYTLPRYEQLFPWPRKGSTDWVHASWIGRKDAENVIIVEAGTHGLEGEAGMLAMRMFLQHQRDLVLKKTAFLFVYPLNAPGYYAGSRDDDAMVDTNRGCLLNFDNVEDRGFGNFVHMISPEAWDWRELDALMLSEHLQEFRDAVTVGQYEYPGSLFYGGRELCGGGRVGQEICADIKRRGTVKRVATVHFHTGLGVYKQVSLISMINDASARKRLMSWLGDDCVLQCPMLGDNGAASKVRGTVPQFLSDQLGPEIECIDVTLDVGGKSTPQTSIPLLARMRWIELHPGQRPAEEEAEIRQKYGRIFWLPDDPDWQRFYVKHACDLLENVLRGVGV